MFNAADNMATLYRDLENARFKLYDLFDDSARTQLYTDGTPNSLFEIGFRSLINNSNVAEVPAADPYDHIAAHYTYNTTTITGYRAFILTPVEKQ